MLTRCPGCRTVFRVRARDLRSARGRVRCGRCATSFDALSDLRDEVEDDARPVLTDAVAHGAEAAAVEPAGLRTVSEEVPAEMEAQPQPPAAPVVRAASEVPSAAAASPGRAAALPGADGPPAPALPRLGAPERDERIEAPLRVRLPLDGPALAGQPRFRFDAPGVPEAPPAPEPSRLRWLWRLLALALFAALAVQLMLWRQEDLLRLAPGLRPFIETACARIGCVVPVARDLARLRIASRDVREHPRYRDALLVNATLVNDAAFDQPYPVLELTLHDVAGRLLGRRRFRPAEYLDDSIDRTAGMPPGVPVHIVLEIAGGANTAVSFEFEFR